MEQGSDIVYSDSDEETFEYPASATDEPDTSDYSARLEEILSDDEELENAAGEDEDEEDFYYTGKDASDTPTGYQEQMRDVLDGDHDSDVDSDDHKSVLDQQDTEQARDGEEWAGQESSYFTALNEPDFGGSSSPIDTIRILDAVSLPQDDDENERLHSYLLPNISRLRSGLQLSSSQSHSADVAVDSTLGLNLHTSNSELASISRASSRSNMNEVKSTANDASPRRDSFKWTRLRSVGELLFTKQPDKATAILGTPPFGLPTVLAVNNFICLGTSVGKVLVFDFKQKLICVCGNDDSAKIFGAVTAVSISRDHTFVACGHVHGHIQLFDLKRPTVAARTVNPTTITSVLSGRSEGHIQGSRIVSIGFIAGRHTAIVSTDDQGLAFYHSLGKVLFMDANDCLRILGRYPVETRKAQQAQLRVSTAMDTEAKPDNQIVPPKINPILAAGHLPLGTSPHPTDNYQLVALLTPIKLVVVGLKPTPKTWFRHHRDEADDTLGALKWRGCLSWFPSILNDGDPKKSKEQSDPLLASSWGSHISVFRVVETRITQKIRNPKTGKMEKIESGKITINEILSYQSTSNILAIQWLNLNQIIFYTATSIEVLDIRTSHVIEKLAFDASKLISSTTPGNTSHDIQHSMRTYKGKIFVLCTDSLMIGTLLTWADKILDLVEQGDFIEAIKLARSFYLNQAEGNKNGLPEDQAEMRAVVGQKLKELMDASSRYAFSEDRFTDATHVSSDNRGVDRTSLFENLVSACASACAALDDFDFLFEDLFQYYDDSGISGIYLRQLERFILDDTIHDPPARITQRIIAMHDEEGSVDAAERLIWHIDPDCLDINQALTLCRKYKLYDAMIYINNTALQDYITPLIEFLGLIREVLRGRRTRLSNLGLEKAKVSNAYKVYDYLSNILCGLTYPSGRTMQTNDAAKAQDDLYSFIFHGRSQSWTGGGTDNLVLTAEEDGGLEPTYPYVRILLRYDAEALLHILDLAFEQSYLTDSEKISRQMIVKILMDIAATTQMPLHSRAVTFINIFIARNVPKYSQFIHIGPSSLQNLLINLASDSDEGTREERQLAAEFLLSVYTPHDSERIIQLFEDAEFYRILQQWYRNDKQWASLLRTYIHDTSPEETVLFANLEKTLQQASRSHNGALPDEIVAIISDEVQFLLDNDVPKTARIINEFAPQLHRRVVDHLGHSGVEKQFTYLRCLMSHPAVQEDQTIIGGSWTTIDNSLQKLYVQYLCRCAPESVLAEIPYIREKSSLNLEDITAVCEDAGMYDVVIWLVNESSASKSLSRYETYSHELARDISASILGPGEENIPSGQTEHALEKISRLYRMGIRICREQSRQSAEPNAPVEDLWFTLLACQIAAVQLLAAISGTGSLHDQVLSALRNLVQESLTELVAISTAMTVSFPRLFKRLVDETGQQRTQSGTPYHEFRNILTGMLTSYRSEEDLLVMSKRIADSDFFETYSDLVRTRSMGWNAMSPICTKCRAPVKVESSKIEGAEQKSIAIAPHGIYHSSCILASA